MLDFHDADGKDDDDMRNDTGEPLLATERIRCGKGRQMAKCWKSPLQLPWYLHGLLLLVYSSVYLLLVLSKLQPSCLEQSRPANLTRPLPSREGLQWGERKFPTNIVDNPFTGAPRPELDEAWHRLLLNDNIRVPKSYLDEQNLTSVYTKDGLEGIASLSAYHSLHCLKKVKKMLFKEYYYHEKSDEAMAREAKHVDHCVEYIRESLMCQPDLSMVTFRWINNTAQHEDKSAFYPTNFDVSLHTCADWQALDTWAGERVFDLFQVDLLKRPEPDQSKRL
ncbi:Uu.00g120110.m01.CDS01 [Anthostomella pinea]|uniref:Uu.00g120110.m01.CDS01 n=1 Tax=Anthostomella pinea TaxID=933095 RepID=A0AAI8VGS6_9PEZI|nr:Uu.00g120110.m01.CDS01 [Anthostomella pinea]